MSGPDFTEERIRDLVTQQSADWFVANRGGLSQSERDAFVSWLKASPMHVEEYLALAGVARDLRAARGTPEDSVEAIVARARNSAEAHSLGSQLRAVLEVVRTSRWHRAGAMIAVASILGLGALLSWSLWPHSAVRSPVASVSLHFETGHGEQQTYRLADGSVVHLNTDSDVTIRYDAARRLVRLGSGEAYFEVAHETHRPFHVLAGAADVVAVGTRFDVRLKDAWTVVTVAEGKVAVGMLAAIGESGSPSGGDLRLRFVPVSAGEQITVAEAGHSAPAAADVDRTTAWLRRQISFDHEPLELVAAEFNRYARKPIEITTPALGKLRVSGVFATDNTAAFIAFLRTLEGVHVEVTSTRIVVSQD